MRVHGSTEKKGHVGRHVVLVDQLVDLREYVYVLFGGQRRRQELTELHQRVLTLIVQTARQLQMPFVERHRAETFLFAFDLIAKHDVIALL